MRVRTNAHDNTESLRGGTSLHPESHLLETLAGSLHPKSHPIRQGQMAGSRRRGHCVRVGDCRHLWLGISVLGTTNLGLLARAML